MRASVSLTLLATALLGGCATFHDGALHDGTLHQDAAGEAAAAMPASVAATQDPPADDSLNAAVWYQTSVERDLVYTAIYRAAGQRLDAALRDKHWDALPHEERSNDFARLPPAIIVDIDETVLDNSPSSVRQIREHRGFNEAAWGEWVNERKARPLPGAVEFLAAAASKGVTVFYISNRDASLAEATLANLRAVGFPLKDDGQFLGLGTVVDGCEQEGSEKACRRQLVARKHRVLMQFGDQVGDFVQVTANTRDGRRAAIAPYLAWIGERWWALPNPLYGSWEPALFDNEWRQPEAARRAAKESALDDGRE
ncbi:5'-nucleotidase, lipoprotein e(P4) family [Lysobacter solisilvae (ex Woo and Kim 2020)]|uniref:Acid phosphatase n=1 Tax=Agrilutibacter terrestris TaxID=2865112 RepID=A0A7H0FTV3_9GAMM|nr:HAD family acid phosphatase [Lysobacter terrestris]QNP39469.1 acid phosphatase [Lysobacter terrestris]